MYKRQAFGLKSVRKVGFCWKLGMFNSSVANLDKNKLLNKYDAFHNATLT